MTLTALIGALVALVPRANGDWLDRLEKLAARVDQLTRSQARLIDNIERLERELLIERNISDHWKAEAQRLARQAREHINGRNALAYAQQNQQQALAQYSQAQQGYHGFCNCVPSRSQVWAATEGEP